MSMLGYLLPFLLFSSCLAIYKPTWDSLDSRPLPSWYDESKVGIFIHWGVFSVPSYGEGFAGEWFWYDWKSLASPSAVYFMESNYPSGFSYADFGPQFTAELYMANKWAKIFEASGARYVVLTSKHHEGYTNWPSVNSWNWNSKDVGPRRDLVGELAEAINKTSLHFGLYHSLFEWYNPLYLEDKNNNFKTQNFVRTKTMPELYDIVTRYNPEVIWSDGQWEANSAYWNSTEFLAWLYNSSPVKDTVVTNDRWGSDTLCKHGGYLTCSDRFNPGKIQTRKWENCMTIDKESWGYRRNAYLSDYLTIEEILETLAKTISCNGNLLINVGPTKSGTIPAVFEERLQQMGAWLGVNGEAVYSSKPWKQANDSMSQDVWYTTSGSNVYAFVLSWPANDVLLLGTPVPTSSSATVDLIGGPSNLKWEPLKPTGVGIMMQALRPSDSAKWAYVLRLKGFQ